MDPIARAPAATPPQAPTELQLVAQELEAVFLAEMLKSAGLGETPDMFGGGAGEEQFSSYLRMEHARAMAQAGGIGLAEEITRALLSEGENAPN